MYTIICNHRPAPLKEEEEGTPSAYHLGNEEFSLLAQFSLSARQIPSLIDHTESLQQTDNQHNYEVFLISP